MVITHVRATQTDGLRFDHLDMLGVSARGARGVLRQRQLLQTESRKQTVGGQEVTERPEGANLAATACGNAYEIKSEVVTTVRFARTARTLLVGNTDMHATVK